MAILGFVGLAIFSLFGIFLWWVSYRSAFHDPYDVGFQPTDVFPFFFCFCYTAVLAIGWGAYFEFV